MRSFMVLLLAALFLLVAAPVQAEEEMPVPTWIVMIISIYGTDEGGGANYTLGVRISENEVLTLKSAVLARSGEKIYLAKISLIVAAGWSVTEAERYRESGEQQIILETEASSTTQAKATVVYNYLPPANSELLSLVLVLLPNGETEIRRVATKVLAVDEKLGLSPLELKVTSAHLKNGVAVNEKGEMTGFIAVYSDGRVFLLPIAPLTPDKTETPFE